MKKLMLLLLFSCISIAVSFAQSGSIPSGDQVGSYSVSSRTGTVWGSLYNQSTPYIIKSSSTLTLYYSHYQYQPVEWKLRSGAPTGTIIREISYDKKKITVDVGASTYGWVVLDLALKAADGKTTNLYFYFNVKE